MKSSQVNFAIECMKTKISRRLVELISSIGRINYISFDQIKLLASDFNESEIPGVQIIDVGLTSIHEQVRAKKTWSLAIEIVLRSTDAEPASQTKLWDLENQVLRKIFSDPNLSIKGVISMDFKGSATDLHLLEPYYFSRLDIDIMFYEDLTGTC